MITPSVSPDLRRESAWWREGVLYQIYVRSFADSNGDGVGDLPGLIDHLDHLEWLGIDGVWLNPTMPSPNADWGYDVADYTDVHPELGTLADLDRLVAEAGRRGIRILLDLVPNHTSDRHPWFLDARSSSEAAHRHWYVWADPRADGSPPNDWTSVFDGPAWTLDGPSGQYYLHNFLAEQPDLNWWSEEVLTAFDDVLRFWFDRGIAGFRVDVAHLIIKDRELEDRWSQPEVHDIHRRWRALGDAQEPQRIFVGETHIRELEEMISFYGTGEDELHLHFNFPFVYEPFDAALAQIVADTERLIPAKSWPAWTGSNHDVGRFPSRWCGGDDGRTRLALLALLTLRGTPFLYYGDEIGMTEVDLPPERLRDPVGLRRWPADPGRDRMRTPMQWSADEGAGFSEPRAEPWLPLGDHRARNVEAQRDDPGSILTFTRDLIALRRRLPELRTGTYEQLSTEADVWAWRRGAGVAVALNLSDRETRVQGLTGTVAVSSPRGREGEAVERELSLGPWEGVVVEGPGP